MVPQLVLREGGGARWGLEADEVQKIFAQGKLNEKTYARPLTLKNIHATAWKNSYKEFDNEKKFLQLENSLLPPYIF